MFKKEYVVHRTPIGTIILEWNGNLWTFGNRFFPVSHCTKIERGFCRGGKALTNLYASLKRKYTGNITTKDETVKFQKWNNLQFAFG